MLRNTLKRLHSYWVILSLILLAACGSTADEVVLMTPTHIPPTQEVRLSLSMTISPTQKPTGTAIPPTPTNIPAPLVCSPFGSVSLSDLPAMVANPFHPPRQGLDGPHQGVDFAYRLNSDSIALEGLPVQAVLSGKVAIVIDNRFPYGNAVLIETTLDNLQGNFLTQLQVPTPAPTIEPHPALTCPTVPATLSWDEEGRSLYLLYAHLKEPVPLELGEEVLCGQVLGAIGSSGNALNPHLHLEARVGPSGARFSGMAHYDTSATAEEMANYCVWRVSGLFQLLHPMRLFTSEP